MKQIGILMLLVASAFGQAPPVPPQPGVVLPNQWFGAGAAYNPSSTPGVAGWATYAHLMPGAMGTAQMYALSSFDVTSVNFKTFQAQSSVREGMAMLFRCYKNSCLFGLGDVGVAVNNGNLGSAFSGGGILVTRFNKTSKWTFNVAARVLKTALGPQQAVYEFGFGRTQ